MIGPFSNLILRINAEHEIPPFDTKRRWWLFAAQAGSNRARRRPPKFNTLEPDVFVTATVGAVAAMTRGCRSSCEAERRVSRRQWALARCFPTALVVFFRCSYGTNFQSTAADSSAQRASRPPTSWSIRSEVLRVGGPRRRCRYAVVTARSLASKRGACQKCACLRRNKKRGRHAVAKTKNPDLFSHHTAEPFSPTCCHTCWHVQSKCGSAHCTCTKSASSRVSCSFFLLSLLLLLLLLGGSGACRIQVPCFFTTKTNHEIETQNSVQVTTIKGVIPFHWANHESETPNCGSHQDKGYTTTSLSTTISLSSHERRVYGDVPPPVATNPGSNPTSMVS